MNFFFRVLIFNLFEESSTQKKMNLIFKFINILNRKIHCQKLMYIRMKTITIQSFQYSYNHNLSPKYSQTSRTTYSIRATKLIWTIRIRLTSLCTLPTNFPCLALSKGWTNASRSGSCQQTNKESEI